MHREKQRTRRTSTPERSSASRFSCALSCSRPVTITFFPKEWKRRASPSPMPPAAPMIKIVLILADIARQVANRCAISTQEYLGTLGVTGRLDIAGDLLWCRVPSSEKNVSAQFCTRTGLHKRLLLHRSTLVTGQIIGRKRSGAVYGRPVVRQG